jgi:hypothetical protein
MKNSIKQITLPSLNALDNLTYDKKPTNWMVFWNLMQGLFILAIVILLVIYVKSQIDGNPISPINLEPDSDFFGSISGKIMLAILALEMLVLTIFTVLKIIWSICFWTGWFRSKNFYYDDGKYNNSLHLSFLNFHFMGEKIIPCENWNNFQKNKLLFLNSVNQLNLRFIQYLHHTEKNK